MSKLIAVWGSPDSGKTSFAVKLASAVYERYNSTVLVPVSYTHLTLPTIA